MAPKSAPKKAADKPVEKKEEKPVEKKEDKPKPPAKQQKAPKEAPVKEAPAETKQKEKAPKQAPKAPAKSSDKGQPKTKAGGKQAKASGKKSSNKNSSAKKKAAPTWAGVHIRNLDYEGISIDSVKNIFKSCSKIIEVRIRHGHHVLVFFDNQQAAKKALDMNGKTVHGNKIKVSLARHAKPTRPREQYCKTIFVGGLPGGTTKKQLATHFAKCGKILKVRVYRERHMGFVYFINNDAARNAMKLAEKPFSHGKDVSKMERVPMELQRKLTLKYSIRNRKLDKAVVAKRFNRRPPSQIEAARIKSENRKARRAKAIKDKQGSATKKGSSSKKGSETKKAGSATKKAGSATKKAGSGTKKAGNAAKKATAPVKK